jgi:hypothetical protein
VIFRRSFVAEFASLITLNCFAIILFLSSFCGNDFRLLELVSGIEQAGLGVLGLSCTLLIILRSLVHSSLRPPTQLSRLSNHQSRRTRFSMVSLVLSSAIKQKDIAEVNSPSVKYVVWVVDGSSVTLMIKRSACCYYFPAITVANRNFSQQSYSRDYSH